MNDDIKPRQSSRGELRSRTRRGAITLLGGGALGLFGLKWLLGARREADLPWPLRRILQLNEKLSRAFFRADRPLEQPVPPVVGVQPRVNGQIGLDDDLDADGWRLEVGDFRLTLADLRALPKTEATCLFKCVEGWSEPMSYGGVRFLDFLEHYKIGTRRNGSPSAQAHDIYEYVSLRTPDGDYYVSIDMASMLHPQTVLAYEMNGVPLDEDNGAPLRLIVPVKYGIKNLKRIGSIAFSDVPGPDYWHERGYDWYAGL